MKRVMTVSSRLSSKGLPCATEDLCAGVTVPIWNSDTWPESPCSSGLWVDLRENPEAFPTGKVFAAGARHPL
jgi:hypothetical protein